MEDPFTVLAKDSRRLQRVNTYEVWNIRRKLADISSQTEFAVFEVRNLLAWKSAQKPRSAASELMDSDKRSLEASQRSRLADVVLRTCSPLLKLINSHKWSFPFNTSVDVNKYPDYLNVVVTPMDLGTIRLRMDSNMYHDPKDFWNDLNLVFDNAKKYNPAGSDCFLMAQTLQEIAQERYDKTIAPRIAEEECAMLAEEQAMQRRRAAAEDAADSAAVEQQCARILHLVDDLQGAVLDLRSEAASLCELVGPTERQALLADLLALPTALLEAMVMFVASRLPSGLQGMASTLDSSKAGEAAPSMPKVLIVLGQYDAVLLRQLQHLTDCTSSSSAAAAEADPRESPVDASSVSLKATSLEAAFQPQACTQQAGTEAPTETSSRGTIPDPAAAAAASVCADPMDVDSMPSTSGIPTVNRTVVASAQAVDSSLQVANTGPAAAEAQPVEPALPIAANQRVISDVVSHPGSIAISAFVGVAWPGLPLGSGIEARPSARVDTGAESAAAAAAAATAAAAAVAAARRAAMTAPKAGIKRRAPTPIQVEFPGGTESSAHQPASTAAKAGMAGSTPSKAGAALAAPGSTPSCAPPASPAAPSQMLSPGGTLGPTSTTGLVNQKSRGGPLTAGGKKRPGSSLPGGGGRGVRKTLALTKGAAAATAAFDTAAGREAAGQKPGDIVVSKPSPVAACGSSVPHHESAPGTAAVLKKSVSASAAAGAAGAAPKASLPASLPSPTPGTSGAPSPASAALAAVLHQMNRVGGLMPTPPLMPGGIGQQGKLSAQQAAAVTAAFGHHQIHQALQAAAAAAAAKGQFSPSFHGFPGGQFSLSSLPAPILDLAKGMTQMAGLGSLQASMFSNVAAAAAASASAQHRPTAPNVAAAAAAAVAAAAAAGLDASSPHHQQQLQVLQAAHLLQQHAIATAASQQQQVHQQGALGQHNAHVQRAASPSNTAWQQQQQRHMVLDLSAGRQAAAAAAAVAAAAAASAVVSVPPVHQSKPPLSKETSEPKPGTDQSIGPDP